MAAREMRNKVASRRSNDSKETAGKTVEELGGYLCDGRLQIWTDGSCLEPRWEARSTVRAGVFLSKSSTLNAHFPIKSRTGQTWMRGELEAVACAILALPLRVHTDCEWVETGVKDILDADGGEDQIFPNKLD